MAGDPTGEQSTTIEQTHVQDYLRRRGFPDAEVRAMRPLGQTSQGRKRYGYGKPLRIRFAAGGKDHDVVLRTMSPDPFGHDRRADRARVLLEAHDNAQGLARHVRPLDVGAFDEDGRLVEMGRGEVFYITEYVPGELYARDLDRLAGQDRPTGTDIERAEALADYLAELHRQSLPARLHTRDIRDTVGSGEGIFGLTDSYPPDDPVAPPGRLMQIELQAVRQRWNKRHLAERARRTHGDFHPYNILFREGTDFSLLDCSRGGAGEPADDVTSLSINYLFSALLARGQLSGPLRQVWDRFWGTYLERSRDPQLLELTPLYFAWRALVLASPVWYPDVDRGVRERLLGFAERLLDGASFDPARIDALM